MNAQGHAGSDAVRLRIATPARNDIEDLLAWTEERFGLAARQRYEALLSRALLDIAEDISRPGVKARPELGANVFSYHLHFSREPAAKRAGRAGARVLRPRHLLVGRTAETGLVDILRVLHDSMEASRHLPEESH